MPFKTSRFRKPFVTFVFLSDLLGGLRLQRPFCIGCVNMVSLQNGFFCAFVGYLNRRMTCNKRDKPRVYLLCVFSGGPLVLQLQEKPCHTGSKYIVLSTMELQMSS